MQTFAAASLCLAVLATWAATDASFRAGVWQAGVALYLKPIEVAADSTDAVAAGITDRMRSIHWDAIGRRAIALYVLLLTGVIATAISCAIAIRHRHAGRVIGCVVLAVGWGTLYGASDTIQDWRSRRQVAAIMPELKQAATALNDQWPTESGTVPPDIAFHVEPNKYPNVLLVRGRQSGWPCQESLGLMITRGKHGIIRFDLAAAYDSRVEFHPNDTMPAPYESGFGYPSPPVSSVEKLKDHWFLVRYGDE